MSSVTLKISSLLIRTLSKPIATRIKQQAKEHDRFRRICISFAQSLHRLDMRLRLGLLQDPAAIERQIAREAAEAQAKKQKSEIPTVKTEAQTKADEAASAKERKKVADKVKHQNEPRIRPLSEAKAIESGANFISEAFLFAVGLGLIGFESWRSRRKENNRRSEVAEKLAELEERDKGKSQQIEELRREIGALEANRTKGSSGWSWNKNKASTTVQVASREPETTNERPKEVTVAANKHGPESSGQMSSG